MSEYLHGYVQTEYERLMHQARFLEQEVYPFIDLANCRHLLEMGCGVGAQTRILLERFPQLHITAIDRSAEELEVARQQLPQDLQHRVRFVQADLLHFQSEEKADAAFCCWMLEHAYEPAAILRNIRRSLKPEAHIFLTEVENNSLTVAPQSAALDAYWDAYNRLQLHLHGWPFIGQELEQLLQSAGFEHIQVVPHPMHYGHHNTERLKDFCAYWWRLIDSASGPLLKGAYINEEQHRLSREHLLNLHLHPEASFRYTFVQARAVAGNKP